MCFSSRKHSSRSLSDKKIKLPSFGSLNLINLRQKLLAEAFCCTGLAPFYDFVNVGLLEINYNDGN